MFPAKAAWQSSHVFGDCLVNHHARLFFVNIPKCASSWTKKYLASYDAGDDHKLFWDRGNFADPELNLAVSFLKKPVDLDRYQPVIFLRDVQQRWLSHRPCLDLIAGAGLETISTIIDTIPAMVHDEHTCPQVNFIQGLDWERSVYFLCDDQLQQRFSGWLADQGLKGYQHTAKTNVSSHDDMYELYRRNWNTLYDYTAVKFTFDWFYHDDIDLIRHTPFF